MKRFFGKSKGREAATSVCFEDGGFSVARVKRFEQGELPQLKLATWAPFSSMEEGRRALDDVVRRNNLRRAPCTFVLPPDTYQLVQIESSGLSAEESREAARWQIRERLDYRAEEAVIDLFDIAPIGGERKPLTYAVAARETFLRGRVHLLKQAGMALEVIDTPEFALRNVCDLFAEDSRGVAILLLLEESGMLVIAREGRLYMVRLLNTGMNALLPYADGQYEALTERLDGIVLEVQRSFDYCESTFQLPMVSRLLVAQTQKEIPAITAYLGQYLAARVENFSFAGVLDVPDGVRQVDLNRQLLAIGGALRGESD